MKNTCIRLLTPLLAALLLSACASTKRDQDLDKTLRQYGQAIRFSQFQAALRYHHPDYLREHPVSELDINRLQQFRITGYEAGPSETLEDGNAVRQRVVIKLYNVRRARERSIAQDQLWRYDAEREAWLLHSALPDVRQR